MPVETATSAAITPLPSPARAPESTGRLATLRGLRRTTVGDTIRLTLDFDGEVAFDHQRLPGPDRVFFDFARTAPIASLSDTVLQFEGPTVRRVRLGRPRPDVTRLAIDLDGVATYSVFALYHPYRLTIDLQPVSHARSSGTSAAAAPAGANPPVTPQAGPTRAAVAVPRTGLVPTAVSMPASMAAPAPPPPVLLRAHRVAAPAVVRPVAAADADRRRRAAPRRRRHADLAGARARRRGCRAGAGAARRSRSRASCCRRAAPSR